MVELQPVRHRVIDGLFDQQLVDSAVSSWPSQDWERWIAYNSIEQTKKTCNVPYYMSRSVTQIIREALCLPVGELLGIGPLIPDPSLYAGGMHSVWPIGSVAQHLDSDSHPLMPWQRRANMILYLNECGGGELVLHGDRERVVVPAAGRLLLFECNDFSLHSVMPVTAGCRKSIMTCFWEPASAVGKRQKAQFKPPESQFHTVP